MKVFHIHFVEWQLRSQGRLQLSFCRILYHDRVASIAVAAVNGNSCIVTVL